MAWRTPRRGRPIGTSGHLKASLNEPNRQEMHQNVECYILHWNLYAKGVWHRDQIPF
jgi:hypothetical protein